MKTTEYETECLYAVCSILDHTDLDVMTDTELLEECNKWTMSLNDDDPMAWDVECNRRLCERHLQLRRMSNEKLLRELERARSAIAYWTHLDGEQIANRISRNLNADVEDYTREMCRRGT